MRKLWKWSFAVLGLAVMFGLVLAPAASAWYPGNNYSPYPAYRYPTYRYPTYPTYPNNGYTYAGCVGCQNYNPGYYNYAYPNNNYSYIYPYNNSYPNYNNYSYVYPYNNNSYPNYNNYSYAQPPLAYNGGGWGSFGTYQNWANAFFQQHGRSPNQQDVNDYWWSQGFAHTYGYSPFPY
jgi:hypothetical protein